MGRGSSNGRPGATGGGGGGARSVNIPKQDSTSAYIHAINDSFKTRADVINNADQVLKQLAPNGRVRMTFDNSDVSAVKMSDGRFQWNERGISYNANGSYSPYNTQRVVRASVVKSGLSNAARFSIMDSDGLESKQFSSRNDQLYYSRGY